MNVVNMELDSAVQFTCLCTTQEVNPETAPDNKKLTEVNLHMVYHSLMTNQGYAGFNRLAGALQRPSLFPKTYEEYAQYRTTRLPCSVHLKPYASTIASWVLSVDASGLLNIDVSFDMSWMKRGHKSHLDIGTVIDADTRIILDFEVMCNLCSSCESQRTKMTTRFPAWYETHKDKCHKNFEGTSAAMEQAAAVHLWQRSTLLGFRYVTFIGDGDSSAYRLVCALNDNAEPYDQPVVKEECINHVGKRIGARLRKLKRTLLGGASMLPDAVVDKLTSYYSKAIRDNIRTNTQTMKKVVLVSYFHLSASQDQHHALCSRGEDSWCFERAESNSKRRNTRETRGQELLEQDTEGRIGAHLGNLQRPRKHRPTRQVLGGSYPV